jgi:hypothetical protein
MTLAREVRAQYDGATVRVYQAFSLEIAEAAVRAQRFVPPFRRDRMTWIKPSFTWMMYRSGWATKPGQERVLAVDITRQGFDWALANAVLTHFVAEIHGTPADYKGLLRAAPVRVQWDPERSASLAPLAWRTIQLGLGERAVPKYADEWTVRITDLTDRVRAIASAPGERRAESMPRELPYPIAEDVALRLAVAPSALR